MKKRKSNKWVTNKVKIILLIVGIPILLLAALVMYVSWFFSVAQNYRPSQHELVAFQENRTIKKSAEAEKQLNNRMSELKGLLLVDDTTVAATSTIDRCYAETDSIMFSFDIFKVCYIRKTVLITSALEPEQLVTRLKNRLERHNMALSEVDTSSCQDRALVEGGSERTVTLGLDFQIGSLVNCESEVRPDEYINSTSYPQKVNYSKIFSESSEQQKAIIGGKKTFIAAGLIQEYFNEKMKDF